MRSAAALVLALGACGTPAAQPDALHSECGHPGDTGNDLGIGKFCTDLTMCGGTAPLCSNIGDPTTYFCTRTCHADAGVDQCGSGASCECGGGATCGCTPTVCL
jgi:hypothetical protein